MSCFTDIENKPDDWLVLDPLTVQKPIPKTGCDTNLLVLNYLSEFKTEDQKKKVKDNLGLFVDNILSKNSNNPISNKAVYEAFNKYVGLRSIKWTSDSDMNNYVDTGMYVILGEKTNAKDNLPILNNGVISARLIVTTTESDNNIVITQILNLNNNVGGEGNIYIRTRQNDKWKSWGKLQTNVEVGLIDQTLMDDLVDNGIYSGILAPTGETFVIICINNYAIAQQVGVQHISHLKYSLVVGTGEIKIEKRTRDAYGFWTEWKSLDDKSLIAKEKTRAELAEEEIKQNTIAAYDMGYSTTTTDMSLEFRTLDGNGSSSVTFPSATTELAGVMSAADKVKLNNSYKKINISPNEIEVELEIETNTEDIQHPAIPAATTTTAGVMSAKDKMFLDSIPNEINKIKDGDTIVGQAREIHSRNGKTVTDSFLARTTAGSGTIGDGVATLKSVGGNVVKNMLGNFNSIVTSLKYNIQFKNDSVIINAKENYIGNTAGSSHIGVSTLNFITGHTYYISANCYSEVDRVLYICPAVNGYNRTTRFANIRANEWQYASRILTVTGDNLTPHLSIYPFGISGDILIQEGALVLYGGINIIDLTEMFGEAKANQMTVAECDKLFGTVDILPQGLTVANPTEFKSTGFNQFNPNNVLEGKAIVDNAIVSGDKKIAIIPCLPCKVGTGENNGYCIHGDFGDDIKVYLTPLNPMEVDGELYMHELVKDATTDTYVPMIKGYMLVEVPTTTNLCAHFLWSEDKCKRDTYEPYHESKIELPSIPEMSEWGLAGITAGQHDTIDLETNKFTKRVGCVDLGSLTWYKAESTRFTTTALQMSTKTVGKIQLVCDKFTVLSTAKYKEMYMDLGVRDVIFPVVLDNNINVITSTEYASLNEFKEAVSSVKLYYELDVPEEYPIVTKAAPNYVGSDYGVEEFMGSKVPLVANILFYMRSLVSETRNFLDRLMAGLGTQDATVVADRILAVVNPAVEPANVEPETSIE